MERHNEIWKAYFNSFEEFEMFKNKVLDDSNIVAAYIRVKNERCFNYEISNRLLFNLDEYKLNNGIDSEIISKVKNRLNEFFVKFESFSGILILKPKDISKLEFRPICIMNLEDEIAINCFFNIFIELIKDTLKLDSKQFGNICPLLNYYSYGNVEEKENNSEDLYLEKWQSSYQKYNRSIVSSLDEDDICVYISDIKSFFVSVTIDNFFDYISSICKHIDFRIFRKVFLLSVSNENECKNINLDKIGIQYINEKFYFCSLPQGMIFSAIFANIYLADILELELNCSMYVDDIHLFSKTLDFRKDVQKLKEYFKKKGLQINLEKTTELTKREIIQDYKRLIQNYGSNVSILRSYTNNKEIDIENEKYVLNNPEDIKKFLEEKCKKYNDTLENNIYLKYLDKINRLIEYRELRYYTYKSETTELYKDTINDLRNIIININKNVSVEENVEKVLYELGAYNAKLYDIDDYVEQLLELYELSNNSFIDNVLFRFLNRNLKLKYENFKELTLKKENILFKDEFYKIKDFDKKEKVNKLYDDFINISFINDDIKNIYIKKRAVFKLFEGVLENEIFKYSNIFYKVKNGDVEFKFENIDKEIYTIKNVGKLIPERKIINSITNLINIVLSNKKTSEYTVWEYRLYILSKSYHKSYERYIQLILKILTDKQMDSFEYIDQDMLLILENTFIPKLWKENYVYVDGLLKLYLIVKRLWEQGSKNQYFYTAHNCEHSKELLKNFEIFIRGQYWKLGLTQIEMLYMYVVFILHDIGMLYIENTDLLILNSNKLKERVYSFINKLNVHKYIDYSEYMKVRYKSIFKERKIGKYKHRKFIFKREKDSKSIYDFYEYFIETYTREIHGVLSAELIEHESLGIKQIIKEMGIDLDFIYCLILGHADIKNYLKFNDCKLDLELLTEIVKLIDLTDVTYKRVNYEFYKLLEKSIPEKSKSEYEKHLKVKDLIIDCDELNNGIIKFIVIKEKRWKTISY